MSRTEIPTAAAALQALDLAGAALELAGLAARAAAYAGAARAPNTTRAYRADWAAFAGWCAQQRLEALPADPSTVALYLTAHAGVLRTSTLHRRLACISSAHQAQGFETPTRSAAVKAVWKGIARQHAEPPRKKTPLVVEAMRAVLAQCDDSARGRRDRAALLIGWGGALRRSELVALDRRDVAIVDEGLVISVRRGKTLAPGESRQVGIPRGRRPDTCPVEAYLAWHELIPDRAVPLLRRVGNVGDITTERWSDRAVARLVKRVAARAGLQGDYSGHSLRSGLATSAAAGGASMAQIMAQTGHRSVTIAQGYIRPVTLFESNAAAVAAL